MGAKNNTVYIWALCGFEGLKGGNSRGKCTAEDGFVVGFCGRRWVVEMDVGLRRIVRGNVVGQGCR